MLEINIKKSDHTLEIFCKSIFTFILLTQTGSGYIYWNKKHIEHMWAVLGQRVPYQLSGYPYFAEENITYKKDRPTSSIDRINNAIHSFCTKLITITHL